MNEKLFGTDGIRAAAGHPPLDDATVRAIGRALAQTLGKKLGRGPRLLSGRDTRESGNRIEATLAAGIREEEGTIDSAGVIPTPGVACLTRLEGYDAGVVISASHNPYQDNGIKVFLPSGRKLDEADEATIEALVPELIYATARQKVVPLEADPTHAERYLDYLCSETAAGLDLTGFTIALDCANGAAFDLAPQLFSSLGASVSAIGVDPNGRNINENCGALHLDGLVRFVIESGANLGVAFDGDADRALFVDATGSTVDGDQTMYLLALDLDSREELSAKRVVATVMSNVGLEVALSRRGIHLARTPVGDKSVLEELLSCGASLGGEQSGHIIFPRISLAGDGMITAIEVLGAMRRQERSLEALVAGMPRYPQMLVNIPVREKRPFDQLPEVAAAAAAVENELAGAGRLLLRYSGTENLARVMIEGENEATIASQAERIARAIRASLS